MRRTRLTRTMVASFAVLLLALLAPGTAFAHGGGLDSKGCHTESATGEYHCHRAGASADAPAPSGNQGDAYDRDDYGGWRDLDGDCQTMRDEVLIDEAERYTLSHNGCWVESGVWQGPFTGKRLVDKSSVHIDHLVPLAEAHGSGAASWSRSKKRRFANDRANLIAVEGATNMSGISWRGN